MKMIIDWLTIIVVVIGLGLLFHFIFNDGIDKMNKMPIKNMSYQLERSN